MASFSAPSSSCPLLQALWKGAGGALPEGLATSVSKAKPASFPESLASSVSKAKPAQPSFPKVVAKAPPIDSLTALTDRVAQVAAEVQAAQIAQAALYAAQAQAEQEHAQASPESWAAQASQFAAQAALTQAAEEAATQAALAQAVEQATALAQAAQAPQGPRIPVQALQAAPPSTQLEDPTATALWARGGGGTSLLSPAVEAAIAAGGSGNWQTSSQGGGSGRWDQGAPTASQGSSFANATPQELEDLAFKKRYLGVITVFYDTKHFGFVKSEEVRTDFGADAFLSDKEKGDFHVGSNVSFVVAVNKTGKPQARFLEFAEGVEQIVSVADDGFMKVIDPAKAKAMKWYIGVVSAFYPGPKFGFVRSEEVTKDYGVDAFLNELELGAARVNSKVKFQVKVGTRGKPQVKNLEVLDLVQPPMPGSMQAMLMDLPNMQPPPHPEEPDLKGIRRQRRENGFDPEAPPIPSIEAPPPTPDDAPPPTPDDRPPPLPDAGRDDRRSRSRRLPGARDDARFRGSARSRDRGDRVDRRDRGSRSRDRGYGRADDRRDGDRSRGQGDRRDDDRGQVRGSRRDDDRGRGDRGDRGDRGGRRGGY